MKTMQELLEGLRTGTIQEWLKQAKADLEKAKQLFAYESNLAKLTEYHTQYHTTVWAIRALQSELKRRDELADANRKRLGLDQPDLGEQLWIDGYGEQLDPDQERRLSVQKRIREKLDKLPPMVTPSKDDPRWKDLELIPEKGDRVRVVCGSPPSDSQSFERIGTRTIYRSGNEQFVFKDFDVLASGPASLLLKEALPPVVEKFPRICGNCANWLHNGAAPYQGWCSYKDSYCHGRGEVCKGFDPIPLPQTPPAEAVKALDHLPTQEEFDPNDPRR